MRKRPRTAVGDKADSVSDRDLGSRLFIDINMNRRKCRKIIGRLPSPIAEDGYGIAPPKPYCLFRVHLDNPLRSPADPPDPRSTSQGDSETNKVLSYRCRPQRRPLPRSGAHPRPAQLSGQRIEGCQFDGNLFPFSEAVLRSFGLVLCAIVAPANGRICLNIGGSCPTALGKVIRFANYSIQTVRLLRLTSAAGVVQI